MAGTSGTTTVSPSPAAQSADRKAQIRLRSALRRLKPVCRWVLAVVFLMGGVTKVTDLHGFAGEVALHSGLPYSAGLVIAAVLPWLELICGACLLAGYAVREAALLLVILLVLLFVYSLLHLNEPDCACFVFPKPEVLAIWWWPPVRNFLLLLCAASTVWR
jgi:putative oxidoreductase